MIINQTVKKIQDRFDINAIYARNIFNLIECQNLSFDEIEKIIKNKPKPFIKWVGGKRQLLVQFRKLNLYPPERFNL